MNDHESLQPPARVPEPGFYYHYKHDPAGPENGYAYEVLGVGHHTEAESTSPDTYMVAYRPLYDWALVYKLGKLFDLRPLDMFLEDVHKPEYEGSRFNKITDPALIERLTKLRDEMYPKGN
jgi:hypothetical protein